MFAMPPETLLRAFQKMLLRKTRVFVTTSLLKAKVFDAETTFDDEGFTRGEVSYWIPVILDSHLDTLDSLEQHAGRSLRRGGMVARRCASRGPAIWTG